MMSDASQQVATTRDKFNTLRNSLEGRVADFKTALPAHMPPERFVRVVLTAAQTNPDLLICDRASLFNACMRAANDGLLPDGRDGAIVVFNTKDKSGQYKKLAQWMPMFQGLLKKFRNSGQFKWVTGQVVREGDQFKHWIDENGEHIEHHPADEDGKITHAYSIATTKDGGSFVDVMTTAQVEKVRAVSRAKDAGPWTQWWDQMAIKTSIRRLSKRLPMSSDLDDMIRRDDELYDLKGEKSDQPAGASPIPLRRMGVETALDHFGGDNAGTEDAEIIDEKTGEVAKNDDAAVLIESARKFGREAFDAGVARKAVPGEFRDPSKTAEAAAWIAGWDEQSSKPKAS